MPSSEHPYEIDIEPVLADCHKVVEQVNSSAEYVTATTLVPLPSPQEKISLHQQRSSNIK